MPLQIVRNDITKMSVDAIVNAANSTLLGGGGVDGAIHAAAGQELLAECRRLGGCNPGQAKLTRGYRLSCKYIIHTVGPIWQGGSQGEADILRSCYRNSLLLAKRRFCKTVAFPLISAGAYGYPKEEALQIAVSTISEFLLKEDMTVYLVVYDRNSFCVSKKLIADIREYIDQHYVDTHVYTRQRMLTDFSDRDCAPMAAPPMEAAMHAPMAAPRMKARKAPVSFGKASLEDLVIQVDESFSQMLLRKIDEKGMKDSECYKKANIDRKLFSKIRKDIHYKPSKPTAIAFAIALELDMTETTELLKKAGFALSHSSVFDIIIEYFIQIGNYDIFQINEALFSFDQSILGG